MSRRGTICTKAAISEVRGGKTNILSGFAERLVSPLPIY